MAQYIDALGLLQTLCTELDVRFTRPRTAM